MIDFLMLISDISAGMIRIMICLLLISRLMHADKPGNKLTLVLTGAACICAIRYLLPMPAFYGIALEALWITVCASRLQKSDARLSLFVGIFYEIAVSFWQFLFAAWLGVLFHSPDFLIQKSGNGQIAVWLLHAVLLACVILISKRPDMTGKEAFRFAAFIVLAGFFAVITLSEQTVLAIADDTLYMWTILSLILTISVLIYNMNRQYEAEKELARLKTQQAELLEHDYTAISNVYAQNAKLFHDFHNHIGVLRQFLSHQKIDKAILYLDELQTPIQNITDTLWTGEETVDYLINSKAAEAKAGEIPFAAEVEFPRHTNLQSPDLCAILGNLLDNALEASKQVKIPEQRRIQLTIRRIHQMLIIKVENNTQTPPLEQEGTLKTSKEANGLHGWGLKSAQTAAAKYDGMIQTSYTDHTFKAVATLSFQGLSSK